MRISDWSSDVCSSDLFAVKRWMITQQRPHFQRVPVEEGRQLFPGAFQGTKIANYASQYFCSMVVHDCGRDDSFQDPAHFRSDERRVGKESVRTCRSRCSAYT